MLESWFLQIATLSRYKELTARPAASEEARKYLGELDQVYFFFDKKQEHLYW